MGYASAATTAAQASSSRTAGTERFAARIQLVNYVFLLLAAADSKQCLLGPLALLAQQAGTAHIQQASQEERTVEHGLVYTPPDVRLENCTIA